MSRDRPAPQALHERFVDTALPTMARLMVVAGLPLLCLALLCRLAPMNAATAVADLLAIACSAVVSLTGLAYLVIRRKLDVRRK